MKYGYINKFEAQEGKRDELMATLLQAAQALETDSDCIQYLVGTTNDTESIYVSEIWTSKQAYDASLELPEVKSIIVKAMPLIASVSIIVDQQIEGGKGSG